ncbi:MAG: Cell surface glycoprotein precursor [Methanosaeta sp. PtaB.Bin018]|nr:MAG: Cell surface glycoprotein precursor [Methanosaeta sp. PtaB.Bin018]
MQQMSTAWPWSSPACATSVIELRRMIFAALIALALLTCAQASTIQSGQDIQAAINSARAGDIILVGPGEHNAFEVDRALTIAGQEGSVLHAAIQKPAIQVSSDGVKISGFKIIGVGKDSTAKFNYFMNNPAAAAGKRLDMPNAAVVISSSDVILENISIFGAQVGVKAENVGNLSIQNTTLESCESGVALLQCRSSKVAGCSFSNCKKYGLDAEECQGIEFNSNRIVNTSGSGALFKESEVCEIQDNVFSGNAFGLSLWRSTLSQVARNRADHNYYGILITDSSNNNTITDNLAEDNSRGEIIAGFGIGISLEENSSYNIVTRNTAKGNFNGLEVSRGCKFNVVYGNDVSDNSHGIRLNENRNNLIFGNNFYDNNINAYENASQNIWNTTRGNYYDDYHGKDEDGDGIGDQPYALRGQDSKSYDHRPMIAFCRNASIDYATLKDDVKKYATYELADDEVPAYQLKGGTIVIASKIPTSPPKWSDSKPLDVTTPPFYK